MLPYLLVFLQVVQSAHLSVSKSLSSTRWLSGKQPKKIKYIRPKSYQAKRTTRYFPKPGSSRGKIKTTISGAHRVDKAFADMIRALFSIGEGMKGIPHVKVTRTFK